MAVHARTGIRSDRMLIAQAMSEDMVLVSNETVFEGYGVRRLWSMSVVDFG
jgi:hypothetical protein